MASQHRKLETWETLLMGVVALAGSAATAYLTAPAFAAAVVAGGAGTGAAVAGNLYTNLLQKKLDEINERWAAGAGLLLNHDLQKAFFRGLSEAARRTVADYARAYPYDHSDRHDAFGQDIAAACEEAEQRLTEADNETKLRCFLDSVKSRHAWDAQELREVAPMFERFLQTATGEPRFGSEFDAFVRRIFPVKAELCFWEKLKHETPAWRAWLRGVLNNFTTHIESVARTQEQHGGKLDDIIRHLAQMQAALEQQDGLPAAFACVCDDLIRQQSDIAAQLLAKLQPIKEQIDKAVGIGEATQAHIKAVSEKADRLLQLATGNNGADRPALRTGATGYAPAWEQDEAANVFADVPHVSGWIERTTLRAHLETQLRENPAVFVGGIAGAGKSSLVASTLEALQAAGKIKSILWHEPDDTAIETIDSLLAKAEALRPLPGASTGEKCRQFLRAIERENSLLVVNGLQLVESTSYLPLVHTAARMRAPARLVLIGDIHHGAPAGFPDLPIIPVEGFTLPELASYLEAKRVRGLSAEQLADLHRKTDGLPDAARLFVDLVVNMNSSPAELLRGAMVSRERFARWFGEITRAMDEDQRTLIQMLSLWGGPFSLEIVRRICESGKLGAFEPTFEQLQRRFVVRRHAPAKWRLQSMIVEFGRASIPPERRAEAVHILAAYAADTAARIWKISHQQSALWHARAAHFYIEGRLYQEAVREIGCIVKVVKNRGYYELLVQLCRTIPLDEIATDPWLFYNYAHCALIVGHWREAVPAIDRLARADLLDPDLSLAAVRLYAEMVIETGGDCRAALAKLREVREKLHAKEVRANVLAHAATIEVRLLTTLGNYPAAEKLAVRQSRAQKADIRGSAIALTSLGVVYEKQGDAQRANRVLKKASNRFFAYGQDVRGFAWCLSHRAICSAQLKHFDDSGRFARQALQMRRDIGEASIDYLNQLNIMALWPEGRFPHEEIAEEIKRVKSRLAVRGYTKEAWAAPHGGQPPIPAGPKGISRHRSPSVPSGKFVA